MTLAMKRSEAVEIVHENRGRPHGIRLVARAHCSFPDESVRCLYATGLSLGGTFILCMRPPPIGTRLKIQLFPTGSYALPPIAARVIGLRIDPSDAERSGFEAVFTELDDSTLDRLSRLVERLNRMVTDRPRLPPRRHVEQRVMPRVATSLGAVVHLFDSPVPVTVLNLSLSGALLGLDWGVRPAGLMPGVEVRLSIPLLEQEITVTALVVRLTGCDEPAGFAVQFFEVSEETELRLEQLMLDALAVGQAPVPE